MHKSVVVRAFAVVAVGTGSLLNQPNTLHAEMF